MLSNHFVSHDRYFTLQKEKVSVQELVLERLRREARYEVSEAEMIEGLLHRLSSYVLQEKIVEKTHTADVTAKVVARATARAVAKVEVPTTWWQHLKRDHFPSWFVRRFPVQVHTVVARKTKQASKTAYNTEQRSITFRQYASFPAANVQTPEKFRGPAMVRREELDLSNWPE